MSKPADQYEIALVRLAAFKMLKGWGVGDPLKDFKTWDLETRKQYASELADWALRKQMEFKTEKPEVGIGRCRGGIDPGWDKCPKCGATSDDECRAPDVTGGG